MLLNTKRKEEEDYPRNSEKLNLRSSFLENSTEKISAEPFIDVMDPKDASPEESVINLDALNIEPDLVKNSWLEESALEDISEWDAVEWENATLKNIAVSLENADISDVSKSGDSEPENTDSIQDVSMYLIENSVPVKERREDVSLEDVIT